MKHLLKHFKAYMVLAVCSAILYSTTVFAGSSPPTYWKQVAQSLWTTKADITQICTSTGADCTVIGGTETGGVVASWNSRTGNVIPVTDDYEIAEIDGMTTAGPGTNYLADDGVYKVVPTDVVTSVFTRVGAIIAAIGDYTASQITNVPAGNISSTGAQAAINELDTEKATAADYMSKAVFDPTTVGGDVFDSANTVFDPSTSGLTKTNVQAELVELSFPASNVSSDVNPAVPWITYHVDASGGDVLITLPDVIAGNDGATYKVYLNDNTNNAIITTVSGTQSIGGFTSQTIVNEEKGMTLQADFDDLHYHIIQDSRPTPSLSSISYLALTEASDIATYLDLATSTDDPDYSTTATDLSTGVITTQAQVLVNWASGTGTIVGNNGTSVSCTGNLRRTVGNGTAKFYTEIYKRTSTGSEILLGTTGMSPALNNATYEQFTISGVLTQSNFGTTDRVVVRFYGERVPGVTDPTYDLQVEGTSPAQCTISVPSGSIAHDSLAAVNDAAAGIAHGHITALAQSITGIKTYLSGILTDGLSIRDTSDITKIIDFDASGITTGNERTIIMADNDVDLTNPAFSTINVYGTNSLNLGTSSSLNGQIGFKNSTNANVTTLVGPVSTGTNTVTIPDTTDTLVGKATTDTFTNKSLDANGTGNAISNIDIADLANGTDGELITWDASGVPAAVSVGTANQVLTSNGAGLPPTFQASGSAPEGTDVVSTAVTLGWVLQADGDNTSSWVALGGGGDALTSNPLSQFAATTSAQFGTVISDSTGTGVVVYATSPSLVTPALGTPSALVGTNISGTAAGLTCGAVSTITGLAPDTATTAAAQANITSLGTLTNLNVDNININGNDISSTAGTDLTITPLGGQQIVLDSTIIVDAGIVTGVTSITSDDFVGPLTGNADTVTAFTPASGTLTLAGADALTFTTANTTNLTLPETGTVSTLAGTEELTGKTITDGTIKDTIGFDAIDTVTYNVTTTTVDWSSYNVGTMTFGAGNIGTLAFTDPTQIGQSIKLILIQDGTGGRTVTAWDADIKWAGGTAPTLSTGIADVDVVTCIRRSADYLCAASLDFS